MARPQLEFGSKNRGKIGSGQHTAPLCDDSAPSGAVWLLDDPSAQCAPSPKCRRGAPSPPITASLFWVFEAVKLLVYVLSKYSSHRLFRKRFFFSAFGPMQQASEPDSGLEENGSGELPAIPGIGAPAQPVRRRRYAMLGQTKHCCTRWRNALYLGVMNKEGGCFHA